MRQGEQQAGANDGHGAEGRSVMRDTFLSEQLPNQVEGTGLAALTMEMLTSSSYSCSYITYN